MRRDLKTAQARVRATLAVASVAKRWAGLKRFHGDPAALAKVEGELLDSVRRLEELSSDTDPREPRRKT